MTGPLLVFYRLATLTIGSAALVITRRNPVHSALFLVITFMGVAGLYVLLEAEFLAAVQVLVYAGGIMVLFLFVIMLVDLEERGRAPRLLPALRPRSVALSVALAVLVVGLLLGAFVAIPYVSGQGGTEILRVHGGNIESVAMGLFRYYVLPFELASVLLLVAMIGAVVLARFRT
jgi:NADH-quinone oxidoreductase subunit J